MAIGLCRLVVWRGACWSIKSTTQGANIVNSTNAPHLLRSHAPAAQPCHSGAVLVLLLCAQPQHLPNRPRGHRTMLEGGTARDAAAEQCQGRRPGGPSGLDGREQRPEGHGSLVPVSCCGRVTYVFVGVRMADGWMRVVAEIEASSRGTRTAVHVSVKAFQSKGWTHVHVHSIGDRPNAIENPALGRSSSEFKSILLS